MSDTVQPITIALTGLSKEEISTLQEDVGNTVALNTYVQNAYGEEEFIKLVLPIGGWVLSNIAWDALSSAIGKVVEALRKRKRTAKTIAIKGSIKFPNGTAAGFNVTTDATRDMKLVFKNVRKELETKQTEITSSGDHPIIVMTTKEESEEVEMRVI